MTRIAFLQGRDQIDRVFTGRQLNRLRTLGDVVLNEVSGPPTIEHLKQQIANADIAITSWGCQPLTQEVLACAPQLQAVLHAAGTVKGVVTPELWERNIRVTSGAEALGKGVAETALGLLIASLKDMWRLSQHTRSGGWDELSRVRELYEVTVGVVGGGKAGGHLIKLLQQFDVDVLLYDPVISHEEAARLGARKVELKQLLTDSDAISIHAPSLPQTVNMFNRKSLALLKDDCILLNTARGSIIDETALVEELQKGRLFACLDVTNPEPPVTDHPFRELPNVILLPHIAGSVNNGLHRLGKFIADDLQLLLEGKTMQGEVTSDLMNVLA